MYYVTFIRRWRVTNVHFKTRHYILYYRTNLLYIQRYTPELWLQRTVLPSDRLKIEFLCVSFLWYILFRLAEIKYDILCSFYDVAYTRASYVVILKTTTYVRERVERTIAVCTTRILWDARRRGNTSGGGIRAPTPWTISRAIRNNVAKVRDGVSRVDPHD